MLHAGLVSVTFRQHSPTEIVNLARRAGLACIEWGGDVHVPHGDLSRAREVRRLTAEAGLRVSAYGSYYRVWPVKPCPFELVLETALELGAPLVRVWAGEIGSVEAESGHCQRVADEARRIAVLAAAAGVGVAFEYHNGTLTDTAVSAQALMRAAAQSELGLYWQTRPELDVEANLAALRAVLPWLRSLHVFHWRAGEDRYERRMLREGQPDWARYLSVVKGGDHDVLLEFVRGDREESFLEDAEVLKEWIG